METDPVSIERLVLVWCIPEEGQGKLPETQHTQLLQDSELGNEFELLWCAKEAACPGLSGDRRARAGSQSGREMWERRESQRSRDFLHGEAQKGQERVLRVDGLGFKR